MKPPSLNPGDQVAIISPSAPVADRKNIVERACRNLKQATEGYDFLVMWMSY